MGLAEAERMTALKKLVKAECTRRAYTGSVASYGGANYDFTIASNEGNKILQEHKQKNWVPLSAINKNTFPIPNTYETKILDSDMTLMEEKVKAWATRVKGSSADNSGTDCASSCTGLCHSCTGACVSGCTSCTGCSGGCSGCSGGCSGSCEMCAWYWGG